jgi:D-alanyl-D-alanine carboxypeptidase
MKTWLSRIALLLALIMLISGTALSIGEEEEEEPKEVISAPTSDLASQLQSILEDIVASPETIFPGALLYVSTPDLGTLTGSAGLGNIETNTAIRYDDKFRAGSIIQLVEEGQFSLDDPMTVILPESVNARFANSSKITLRMLLNHTSGIPEWNNETVDTEIFSHPTKIWEVDEYLDLAAMQ